MPTLIPPNCNCQSCRPALLPPQPPSSFSIYQRAVTSSPPPPVPPQPLQYRFSEPIRIISPMSSSPKPPTPPTRQYQLIPIRNQTYALSQNRLHDFSAPINRYVQKVPATNGTLFASFGKKDSQQTRRSQYIDSTTSDENPARNEPMNENGVEKRQNAYYYNELRIETRLKPNEPDPLPTTTTTTVTPTLNTDFDETTNAPLNGSETNENDARRKEIDDEVARNTRFNANIACSSSASLDSII